MGRVLRWLFLLFLMVLALLRVRYELRLALDSYFRGNTVMTPDLRGLSVDEARAGLRGKLELEVARQTYDPRIPKGTIISQDPPPDIRVRTGKTLFLRVSRGADLQEVPELVGTDLRKASIALRNAGLQVGALCMVRDPRADSSGGGAVVNQSPPPGARLGRGGRVDLLIASASQEKNRFLPRVEGLPKERAWTVLKGAEVKRIHLLEEERDDVPPGEVVLQDPPGGTFYEEGTLLKLTVAIPPGTGPARKVLELGYEIPPGLTARTLVVVVRDEAGRRVVHHSRHLPGEQVGLTAEGRGDVRVEYYLDDFLVLEEIY